MEKLAQWKNTSMENVISQYAATALVHLTNGGGGEFLQSLHEMQSMKLEMMAVKTKMTKWKNRILLRQYNEDVNIWKSSDYWKVKETFHSIFCGSAVDS